MTPIFHGGSPLLPIFPLLLPPSSAVPGASVAGIAGVGGFGAGGSTVGVDDGAQLIT